MFVSRSVRTLFLTPLLFACQVGSPDHDAPVPSGVVADAATLQNLADLIRAYQQASGCNVTYDEATGARLAGIPVSTIGDAELNTILVGPIVADVEAPADELQFSLIPLEYANAGETAQVVDELISRSTRGTRDLRVSVLADQRTNALLVSATADRLQLVRQLVELLDVEAPGGAATGG